MNPPKQHANFKFFECENAKQNSKRALRAGTPQIKSLKEALLLVYFVIAILFNDNGSI